MPQITKNVSVVILTKNRAALLRKCLRSLMKQSIMPTEIVIVNNASTDRTSQVIQQFSGRLPIKPFVTSSSGYPKLYNFAAHQTTQPIVAFLDDDCVADQHWVEAILAAHERKFAAVYQGISYSLPDDNIYAAIMGDHYQNWLKAHTMPDTLLMTVMDNKNCSIPRRILFKYGLFNESLHTGSEDIELAKRLRRQNVPIFLNPNMIAYHHERDTLNGFIQQHWRIAQSEKIIDRMASTQDKIGGIVTKKTYLNIRSFLKREGVYLRSLQLYKVLQVAALYVLLGIIRSVGYFSK